ncbi:hypothetical protein EJ110_NYTH55946 [Nymphaea thermarum]|nr:hypothetical protein EJ110_NYTH55946 [Nymphaea thermarum]
MLSEVSDDLLPLLASATDSKTVMDLHDVLQRFAFVTYAGGILETWHSCRHRLVAKRLVLDDTQEIEATCLALGDWSDLVRVIGGYRLGAAELVEAEKEEREEVVGNTEEYSAEHSTSKRQRAEGELEIVAAATGQYDRPSLAYGAPRPADIMAKDTRTKLTSGMDYSLARRIPPDRLITLVPCEVDLVVEGRANSSRPQYKVQPRMGASHISDVRGLRLTRSSAARASGPRLRASLRLLPLQQGSASGQGWPMVGERKRPKLSTREPMHVEPSAREVVKLRVTKTCLRDRHLSSLQAKHMRLQCEVRTEQQRPKRKR